MKDTINVLFLHHSTGKNILRGNTNAYWYKLTKRGDVTNWFKKYNRSHKPKIVLSERFFPGAGLYGWKNYPYDYYHIWVKNAGHQPYMDEPTLEVLTRSYDVIILKHCFTGSDILPDTGTPDADSEEKRLGNYKAQYLKLKEKMHGFPDTKFIVWTLSALTEKSTTPENATRAKEFCDWVKNEWNEQDDNIYLFDFYSLETEGGLYIKPEYARGETDSHPNEAFSTRVASLFCQRIIDVIHGKQ